MTDQTAPLHWRETDAGRVPVSDQFDDPYYSLVGGLDETRHVFVNGNGLPARWDQDLQIAELGFGTGLNLLVTWADWLKAPHGKLHFTSFEAFPMDKADMADALSAFPEVTDLSAILLDRWSADDGPVTLAEGLTLEVIIGDARQTLPAWQGRADAWYLDGFSPAKNPQLWEPSLLQAVADHTNAGGTAATYSAAGHVRQSLTQAGFTVSRVKGFGTKRHMTVAEMSDAE